MEDLEERQTKENDSQTFSDEGFGSATQGQATTSKFGAGAMYGDCSTIAARRPRFELYVSYGVLSRS